MHPIRNIARRHPFLSLFGLAVLSNLAGSLFNSFYNLQLVVARELDPAQRAVFWDVALPVYNVVASPICLGVLVSLLLPLRRCLTALRRGEPVPPAQLERCRQRLVNLPFTTIC